MNKYVELTDAVKNKIVLLYMGCKLHQIEYGSIEELTNKIILAGITGKKITFVSAYKIYEAQELIEWVEEYIYEKIKERLYLKGELNRDNLRILKLVDEKEIFLNTIAQTLELDFFDEIDREDIYLAFFNTYIIRTATVAFIPTVDTKNKVCSIIEKAIKEYKTIKINS